MFDSFPLKLKPILQEKIWGGDGLHRYLGKGQATDKSMGESWELSDRDGFASIIEAGTYQGRNLYELLQEFPQEILGTPKISSTHTTNIKVVFPLLYKFIYARDALSVQVHPGENNPLGEAKTEAWYIVHAPENAQLIVGLQAGLSAEATLQILQSKDCEKALQKIKVQAGDMLFIPAGTVHAITAGLLIYEVQQNSDTTFRLYDWGRMDDAGKPRQLHIQESAAVIDFTPHREHKINPLKIKKVSYKVEYLVVCKYFAIIKYSGLTEIMPFSTKNRFCVFTCLIGSFILQSADKTLKMHSGDTWLIPAACEDLTVTAQDLGSQFLCSYVPDIAVDIIAPLHAAGFAKEVINQLGINYG